MGRHRQRHHRVSQAHVHDHDGDDGLHKRLVIFRNFLEFPHKTSQYPYNNYEDGVFDSNLYFQLIRCSI